MMDRLWQDLRFGLRKFLKQPTFTLVVIMTLTLGVGATTAVFSLIHGILLRPFPYREPDRLVKLSAMCATRRRRTKRIWRSITRYE
jgi:putative ABC transport system permease protein